MAFRYSLMGYTTFYAATDIMYIHTLFLQCYYATVMNQLIHVH